MERDQIKELLKEVLGPNIPLVDHPKWVGLQCPLAPWKHASGRDSSPSAGVSVNEDGTSIFNCYGCHSKGPVTYLLKELEKFTGENYAALIRAIDGEEFLGGSIPEWGAKRKHEGKTVFLDKEQYLNLYDSAEGHWYLKERKIKDSTARKLNLLVDPEDSQLEERILFPVFDKTGELYGFSGRAVFKTAELKVRDYHGLPKAKVLLGEHLIEPSDPYVIVVEGLFDYARLVQYNLPVVATMHAGLTDYQAAKLLNLGLPIIEMYDNDAAGVGAKEVLAKGIHGKLPISATKYPKRGDKKRPKPAAKDPDGLSYEEVMWMIDHSTIV